MGGLKKMQSYEDDASISIDKKEGKVMVNGKIYIYSPNLPEIEELKDILKTLEEINSNVEDLDFDDDDEYNEKASEVKYISERFYSFSGELSCLEGKAVLKDRHDQLWSLLTEIKSNLDDLSKHFVEIESIVKGYDDVKDSDYWHDDGVFWASDEIVEDFGNGIVKRNVINWETEVHSFMSSDLNGKTKHGFLTITKEALEKGGKYKLVHVPD